MSDDHPDVQQARERTISQAFVSGQMDAQLIHADEATRPHLKLLQAKAYALAQASADALIAAVRAEAEAENRRLREALARYGNHDWDCAARPVTLSGPGADFTAVGHCSCGLADTGRPE